MRRTLLAALLLGVAGMTLAFPPAHHTAASPADVRLVVLFASGWNSHLSADERGSVVSGAEAWNPARNALQSALPEGLANCADVDRQDFSSCTTSFSYTYGANRLNSGFPTSYTACDTLKSIKDSAKAMDAQVSDLEARFPNAKVVIAAHSLGGVVASYWAGTTATSLARLGGVVTFDSPVGGLSWASVRDVLEVVQLTTGHGGGAPGAAGTEMLSKFIGSYQCPRTAAVFEDQLDPLRDQSVLAEVANAQARVVKAGGELRNLGSWGDPFIFGWNAAPVGKLIEGFLPLESCFATLQHPVTAWIWHASLPVTLPDPASCLKQVHGAILAHPPALAVLSSVAEKAFDRRGAATSPVSTRSSTVTSSPTPAVQALRLPAGLEQYQTAVDLFLNARAAGDVVKARQAFSDDYDNFIVMGNWGGAGTSAQIPLTDDNLRVLLSPKVSVVGVASQFGAGAYSPSSPCNLCRPAYGLLLRGLSGQTFLSVRHGAPPYTILDDKMEDEALLVFRADIRPGFGSNKFFGLGERGPFELVSGPVSPPSTSTSTPASGSAEAFNRAVQYGTGAIMVDHITRDACEAAGAKGRVCAQRVSTISDDMSLGLGQVPAGTDIGGFVITMGRFSDGTWGFFDSGNGTPLRPIRLPWKGIVCTEGDTLNIRAQPSTNAAIVGALPDNAKVTVEEFVLASAGTFENRRPGNGWYRINSAKPGWIFSEFLFEDVAGISCGDWWQRVRSTGR